MKTTPSAIKRAIMVAKAIGSKIDPSFASVDMPTDGVPLMRADGGEAEHFSRGGLPTLKPAIRHKNKIYSSVADHLSALSNIQNPEEYRNARIDADNRGYINERGQYMDRYRAQQYAKEHGLIRPDAPSWAHSAHELISENLIRYPDQEERNKKLLSGEGYSVGGEAAPKFYSQGARQAAALPQESGSPEQMLGMLANRGVKPDEMQASGVEQAFGKAPKVSRQQLAEHFQSRMPEVGEEVTREGSGNTAWERFREMEPRIKLPGGENYREITMHAPNFEDKREKVHLELLRMKKAMKNVRAAHKMGSPISYEDAERRLKENEDGDYGSPPAYIHEMRDMDLSPSAEHGWDEKGKYYLHGRAPAYESGHFDRPNVLGHLRLMDRNLPNGERALHVDEAQSDWGQDARKHGTYDPSRPWSVFDTNTGKHVYGHATRSEAVNDTASEPHLDFEHVSEGERVPHHPLIAKTENWADLLMKRALHEAAAGGYDKMLITPGQEQADRYGLEKHISALEYMPIPGREGLVQGKGHNGQVVLSKKATPDELEQLLGKDVTQRLLATEPDSDYIHRLEGTDLRSGGEGMKAFYDNILLKRLARLAKMHGSEAKIGSESLAVPASNEKGESQTRETRLHSLPITPEMRESILKNGFPAYKQGGEVEEGNSDDEVHEHFRDGGSPDMDKVREALQRTASPFSDDPEKVREALRISEGLKTPMSGQTGTGSFYGVRQPHDVADVDPTIIPIPGVEPLEKRHRSWDDLVKEGEGGTLINLGGDRSNLGRLTHVNKKELAWPVDLHAGPKYMLEPNKGQVWANAAGHTTAIKKIIQEASKKGPVYGVYSPMGPRAVDSSHNMIDALLAQIPGSEISHKDAERFDEDLRAGKHAVPKIKARAIELMANWPGILNAKAASEFARNLPGAHRSSIVKHMDKSTWRDAGFPAVGVTRAAISDPDVKGVSGNMFGHRVVRLSAEDAGHEPSFTHSTYTGPTHGEYFGDVPLAQRHYVMPDVIEKMLGKPAAGGQIVHPYSLDPMGRGTARKLFEEQKQQQPINQRMRESIQQGLERQKEYGLNKGGAAVDRAVTVAMKAKKRS